MLMEAVNSYLSIRRAAGYDLRSVERTLHSFARFASDRGEAHIRAESAVEWARMGRSPHARDARLRAVMRLAHHVRAEDPKHEFPHHDDFGPPLNRRVPYIFSRDQARQLMEASQFLKLAQSLRPLTYYTLFGLLWTTGLRLAEALALRTDDVTHDRLLIRSTKFPKSRLTPVHEATVAAIERYLVMRRQVLTEGHHLFVGLHGRPLSQQAVRAVFRCLVRRLGYHHGDSRHTPQVHDLRHSFASIALQCCSYGRDHVGRHLLALTTYMGHTCVASTYWYLRASPQLFGDIALAQESFIGREVR